MAELVVSMVLDRLISFLGAEAKLFGGIKKEVEDIRIELDYIACFLREVNSMVGKEDNINGGLKLWVKHVREVAYQIEDVIDEHMLYRVTQHHQQGDGIERSNKHIDPRMGLHFVDSEALVGIDSSREELDVRLADTDPKHTVVSVVGMGGVGKTTLVKEIFDDQVMAGRFDCHAWITVSQSYKVEVLLRTMARKMYQSQKQSPPVWVDSMDGVELISQCRDYLYDKRYIVVLDDV